LHFLFLRPTPGVPPKMIRTVPPRRKQTPLSRTQVQVLALLAATVVGIYLCYRLCEPFLAPLAWAVALAIVAYPAHEWISRRNKQPNLAAGISVVLVALMLLLPVAFVSRQLAIEAQHAADVAQSDEMRERWNTMIDRYPRLGRVLEGFRRQIDLEEEGNAVAEKIAPSVPGVLSGSLWIAAAMLITLLALFFFLRDAWPTLRAIRSLLPLSSSEATKLFSRIEDTIFATVYGTVVVAVVQGFLGGLMFWWLGLSSPLLWGVMMGLLAIVPVLGAFVVWVPAALWLLIEGDWTKALILTLWGGVVIALVDNLLYPVLVGNRLRMHTLLVFFAIAGGLGMFGAAGLVLGPVILAITLGLIDVWRSRTADEAISAAA
jgi:predicted PurR-regulated permease PerM